MIAEVIPSAYDAKGKKVFRPFDRNKGLRPTFPLGRYVSQPLRVHCQSIADVREFLTHCKPVSDKELFDKEDYWQPPDEFEKRKKGDCEDFSFWTWRQFLDLGYDARVVFGQHGRYGIGHAWVQFDENGSCFLVEPQACRLGAVLPKLSTLRYRPQYSVAWDGEKLTYYQHSTRSSQASIFCLARLLPEYLLFWGRFWLGAPLRIPRACWFLLRRFLRGFRWTGKTRPS
jgi:hypothetical protein